MQWWDAADDLWFAFRLRAAALEHLVGALARNAMALAGMLLIV